ncbi:MAG: VWA domain-containing protein [Clostridia bacterium]|nr:VWA domain-containing protein [Clostridia bacterium]
MIDISFDNPYLLFIAIPLLLIVLVPFFIANGKENRSKNTLVSLILHLVIVFCVTFGAAGTKLTTVITETEVYVVADVSYSANKNLDKVNEYIETVEDELPRNAKLGVVCFGKNSHLLTPLGGKLVSVENADVNDSATDIVQALDYTATLFGENTEKRIVLITDAKQTDEENGLADFIRTVEELYARDIRIDAMYLDDNYSEDTKEVQINSVEYIRSTYSNYQTTASVLVQSSYDANAVVTLYKGGEVYKENPVLLTKGFNVVNFELQTDTKGDFDYTVKVGGCSDELGVNNEYSFTQSVSDGMKVLLVSSEQSDEAVVKAMYGETVEVDAYVDDPNVPCSIEDICQYDEIVLSNVDVRSLNNFTAFVDCINVAVSEFGKSLLTFGDLQIQNKSDDVLKRLEDMLPVDYGKVATEAKLIGIALDISRSIENVGQFRMIKEAAKQMIDLAGPNDVICMYTFAAEINEFQSPAVLTEDERADLKEDIDNIQSEHGTCINEGLRAIGNRLLAEQQEYGYADPQIMLISDGISYMGDTGGEDDPVDAAAEVYAQGIKISAFAVARDYGNGTPSNVTKMQAIAEAGGGEAYWAKTEATLQELILTEVANDVLETVVETASPVKIDKKYDDTVRQFAGTNIAIPDLDGFVTAKEKGGASRVLSTVFVKTKLDPDTGKEIKNTYTIPVYTHWGYGNGKVATFTSTLSGAWSEAFRSSDFGKTFLSNVSRTNRPTEQWSYPYRIEASSDGAYGVVALTPATINPNATVTAKISLPSGLQYNQKLVFDATQYIYRFATPDKGKYTVELTYAYSDKTFTTKTSFTVNYLPEYNALTVFDSAELYAAIRNRGTVTEDGTISLAPDEDSVSTYVVELTPTLLIITVVLFVVDVGVRKLKWDDIKNLFKRSGKKGKGGGQV